MTIPKGRPVIGKKPHRTAEIEAFGEAGVKGVVKKQSIGSYPYSNILQDGSHRLCIVIIFPMLLKLEKGEVA